MTSVRPSPLPIPGVRIGHAHDARVKTGVTVILPDTAALCAVDVRGGGPGTRETDTLALGGLIERVHAVVLSGGSVYGLAAADAVCRELGAQGVGFAAAPPPVPVSPIVPSAILFDNTNGGDKGWGAVPPFARLGAEALAAVSARSPEGSVGAGHGATAGTHAGGFGVASERVALNPSGEEPGEEERGGQKRGRAATVCALIAANPVGSPFLPGTNVPHAWIHERDGEFGGAEPPAGYRWSPPDDTKLSRFAREPGDGAGQSTVIGVVLTDALLSPSALKRLAVMAQDGLALAVQPSHTPLDGDTLFALSVG
ncbi:MAG: P1 family peptidase, partial [Litorimonas sp.]